MRFGNKWTFYFIERRLKSDLGTNRREGEMWCRKWIIPGNCTNWWNWDHSDRKVAPIILTYKWHHHNTVVLYTVLSNSQSEFIIGAVRRIDKLDFHNLCFVIAFFKDKKTISLTTLKFELCLSMPVSVFLPDLKVVADWLIVALVELVVDLGL